MTGRYVLNIGEASAKIWIQFFYEFTLNGMSNVQIAIDGASTEYATEFDVEKDVEIYKSGILIFKGTTISQKAMSGGGIVLTCYGIEHELSDDKVPIISGTTRAFTSTNDHSIMSTLVAAVSGWTLNTTNSTSTSIDSFRVNATESVWNAIIRLISQTGKDIDIDQSTRTIYLYDELTRNDQFAFVEGKNAKDISRDNKRSAAGKVIVYGKGDGDNQIVGSNGTGTPVHTIIDRNIISTDEANARALVEYNKLNPQQKSYTLEPTLPIDGLQIGDSGDIINPSAGINEVVDLVRSRILVDGVGTEKIDLEVTNAQFRLASKNAAEDAAASAFNYATSQSSMQGSGNVQVWGKGINAKSGQALKIPFNVSPELVNDDAGNLRVLTLTVDYDLDGYNQQYGTASFDGGDPQVQNDSANTQPTVAGDSGSTAPTVSGTSEFGGTFNEDDTGEEILSSVTLTTSYVKVADVNPATGNSAGLFINLSVGRSTSTDFARLEVKVESSTGITYCENWDGIIATFRPTGATTGTTGSNTHFSLFVPENTNGETYDVYVRMTSSTGATSESNWQCRTGWLTLGRHTHSDGSYAAANHLHDDGTYAASNHGHADGTYDINSADIDNISIGDGVSESGIVNATSVDLYLDFWNGSSWVQKHSVTSSGVTINQDVDISNGGAFPDATGFWRVRVEPNSATPDFAQGIVKLKHNLDN